VTTALTTSEELAALPMSEHPQAFLDHLLPVLAQVRGAAT
jgi:hypothetical protein